MAEEIKIFDWDLEDFSLDNMKKVLLSKLRPDWPLDDIEERAMTDGIVNFLRVYSVGSDLKDALVLRVYQGEYKYVDRSTEILVMQMAHNVGSFPPLVALFGNGMVYEYAKGRSMKAPDFADPKIIPALAATVAQLHSVDHESAILVDKHGQKIKYPVKFDFYDVMRHRLETVPDHLPDPARDAIYKEKGLTVEVLEKDIVFLEEFLEPLGLSKCLCHHDFHQHNCIYNEETDSVALLDYETARIGYEAFDIGGLYVAATFHSMIPNFFENNIPPNYTEEVKRTWVKEYLKRRYESQGLTPSDITEDDIEKLMIEHQMMEGLYAMHWAMSLMMVIANPNFPFPVERHLNVMYQKFLDAREELPGLKERYLEVKARIDAR